MLTLLLAFLIGIVAGLRAMTAPTMVSWAARTGVLPLGGSWLAFLGYKWTLWIFTVAAIGELINDKLPKTPSRTVPPQFITRVVSGAVSGAAIGIPVGGAVGGLVAGGLGAVVGTLSGARLRAALVRANGGKDLPIALLEDAVAIVVGIVVVKHLG